jgi:hypothetical protein
MISVGSPEIMATLFEINMGVSYCPGTESFIGCTCNIWAHVPDGISYDTIQVKNLVSPESQYRKNQKLLGQVTVTRYCKKIGISMVEMAMRLREGISTIECGDQEKELRSLSPFHFRRLRLNFGLDFLKTVHIIRWVKLHVNLL